MKNDQSSGQSVAEAENLPNFWLHKRIFGGESRYPVKLQILCKFVC